MKSSLLALLLTAAAAVAGAQGVTGHSHEFLLAKIAASEGRFDEALSRMEKVLATTPNDPILLYERALMMLDAGMVERGEGELAKLVAAHPGFYDAQRILGRVLLDRAGADRARLDKALEHLKAAFKLQPDDLATGTAVSQILVASGRVEEAETIVAQLLERFPDQRALNYNYALILTKLGRGDESKKYLERCVQLDPTFGPAILQLVDIYQKENEWAKAAELLEPLISDDPASLDLRRQQAFYWLRADRPEKAREIFRSLVEADPNDVRSLFYLAEALADLEEYDEAEKIFRVLLEKDARDVDVLASFGLAQIGQRKLAEAEKTFRQLLAIGDLPDNIEALAKTQLAFIHGQKGDHDAALASAKEVLVFRDKPNGQGVNIALDALRRQKKFREAIALLDPLVAKFPSDPLVNARQIEMYLRAGEKEKARIAAATQAKFGTRNTTAAAEAYIQAGEHGAAIAFLKQALDGKAGDLDLRFSLGAAYERAGDHTSAEKAFLAVLEQHPDHAATLNYLGYMWADKGVNLDRAAEMLKKAVSQEPRNGAYVDSLGWVYFRKGQLDLAEKYLTDATRLLPRDATVLGHLGDVFAKRGDLMRALSLYRRALGLEPEAKEEEKLRAKIAELERQTQSAQQR